MNIDLIIAAISAVVTATGVGVGIANQQHDKRRRAVEGQQQAEEKAREESRRTSVEAEKARLSTFRMARQLIKYKRSKLAELAIAGQRAYQWDREIPLLSLPGWIPRRPLEIANVKLRISELAQSDESTLDTTRSKLELLGYWPLDRDECKITDYSQAVLEYDDSTRLTDRPSYRLVDVIPTTRSYSLAFTHGTYFDGIDTAEPLAHETAIRYLDKEEPLAGPYRELLADPFRLLNRAAMPGINTLTIRLSDKGPHFFMHQRGNHAGSAQGGFHVAPAGEFQPQIDEPTIWTADLTILNNIIREFCEEFLGIEEADGTGSKLIEYTEDLPFSRFTQAYQRGTMKVFYLGIGLDPLSWKPEILTACVFEEDEFDEIFEGMVTDQIDEGTGGHLMVGRIRPIRGKSGKTYTGLPFTPENISLYADVAKTLPAGVACLTLAKRWTRYLVV